jgi:hypothetical protein
VIVSSLGDEVVPIEIRSNEQTIGIFIAADFVTLSKGRLRFLFREPPP